MSNIWFTSDPHYWHQNVIKYCARPFSSVDEMNEEMVRKHNEKVKPEDTVIYLGDFSLAFRPVEAYSHRLNGTRYLVPGNHDFLHSYHKKSRTPDNQDKWIQKYKDYGWIVLPEISNMLLSDIGHVTLCHHPYSGPYEIENGGDKYEKWRPEDRGIPLICGHVHEKWKTRKSPKGTPMVNVGVDVHDFYPVSLAEVASLLKGT